MKLCSCPLESMYCLKKCPGVHYLITYNWRNCQCMWKRTVNKKNCTPSVSPPDFVSHPSPWRRWIPIRTSCYFTLFVCSQVCGGNGSLLHCEFGTAGHWRSPAFLVSVNYGSPATCKLLPLTWMQTEKRSTTQSCQMQTHVVAGNWAPYHGRSISALCVHQAFRRTCDWSACIGGEVSVLRFWTDDAQILLHPDSVEPSAIRTVLRLGRLGFLCLCEGLFRATKVWSKYQYQTVSRTWLLTFRFNQCLERVTLDTQHSRT